MTARSLLPQPTSSTAPTPAFARAVRALRRFSLVVLLGASACGARQPSECREVEVFDIAWNVDFTLNAGEDGASRSVLVRIYQLADASSFRRLSYESLWATATDAPIPDALGEPVELRLVPGQPLTLPMRRVPEARYIAVAAKFRLITNDWMAIAPLPAPLDLCAEDPKPHSVVRFRAFDQRLQPLAPPTKGAKP